MEVGATIGKYQASWKLQGGGYTLTYNVPKSTTGQLVLPVLSKGRMPNISVDGIPVPKSMKPQLVGEGVMMTGEGGSHTIVIR